MSPKRTFPALPGDVTGDGTRGPSARKASVLPLSYGSSPAPGLIPTVSLSKQAAQAEAALALEVHARFGEFAACDKMRLVDAEKRGKCR